MTKTLNISDNNWKDMNLIRLNFSCKTMNDVITLLIDTFTDSDIKTPQNSLKQLKTASVKEDKNE